MKYFDYASTNPIKFDIFKELLNNEEVKEGLYNPSSINSCGLRSKFYLQKARNIIAYELKCAPDEIIFTSGGTESNNMALMGIALKEGLDSKKHIITTSIEHPSILNTCKRLESLGWKITYLPVNTNGLIDFQDLKNAINENTVLISIMTKNNETGTCQEIKQISKIAKENNIPFHSDCVQGLSRIVRKGIYDYDMMSLSGHKFGAFPGSGILFKKRNIKIEPLICGGGQENGLRSGTENVLGNLFMALCLRDEFESCNSLLISKLNAIFIDSLMDYYGDNIKVNNPVFNNIINLSFKNLDGRIIQQLLSEKGYMVSTGSACNSNGDEEVSHVLKAMQVPEDFIHGAIRISLGYNVSKQDLDELKEAIIETVDYLYSMKGGE